MGFFVFFVLLVKWFGGEIGIHVRLKIECEMREGSSPSRTTKKIKKYFTKCLADWKSLHIFVKQIGLEVNCLIIQ